MKTLLLLLISIAAVTTADIAMLGIRIHSPAASTASLGLKVLNSQDSTTKYKTADGNHLSITIEGGNVVFMENDWLHDKLANKPLFTDFIFGETTLKEIRKTFGTNGFSYRDKSYLKSEIDLATINCFEIDSPNNEVLVVITKAPIKSITDKDDVAGFLKLDAIILSDKKYLDGIWGKKKFYDPEYKKIKL